MRNSSTVPVPYLMTREPLGKLFEEEQKTRGGTSTC
jgi:hypothetical protein